MRDRRLIMILGFVEYTGTNYLRDLLCLHPECFRTQAVEEDRVLLGADLLEEYQHRIYDRPVKAVAEQICSALPPDEFFLSMGEGLCDFLLKQPVQKGLVPGQEGKQDRLPPGARLVTKTPSTRNLGFFFKLFPEMPLLIIVRDPRDVAEAGAVGCGWSREWALRTWAARAREFQVFEEAHPEYRDRYRVIRYEDLVTDPKSGMSGVLDFLGLDAAVYDMDQARALPAEGVSFFKGEGRPDSAATGKDPRFDPGNQYGGLTRAMHERCDWIAGDEMPVFEYVPNPRTRVRGYRRFYQRILDFGWDLWQGWHRWHGAWDRKKRAILSSLRGMASGKTEGGR